MKYILSLSAVETALVSRLYGMPPFPPRAFMHEDYPRRVQYRAVAALCRKQVLYCVFHDDCILSGKQYRKRKYAVSNAVRKIVSFEMSV